MCVVVNCGTALGALATVAEQVGDIIGNGIALFPVEVVGQLCSELLISGIGDDRTRPKPCRTCDTKCVMSLAVN